LAQNRAPRTTQPEPSVCGQAVEYPAKPEKVDRHITWYASPYLWSCSVGLVSGWRTSLTEIVLTYGKQ